LSRIILTDDFEKAVKELNPDEVVYEKELKVEHVKKIRDIAYVAEKRKKLILIAAEKYSVVSQNALLKLLEEPPANIDFVLLAKSKYGLLDTVKSRLIIQKRFYNLTNESDIDISSITNEKILEVLQKNLDTDEVKALIYKILKEKKLNEEQMKILTDAIKMVELNIDKNAVLSLIFLAIKERF
jgi:DNA polymerase-3 subunit delta'